MLRGSIFVFLFTTFLNASVLCHIPTARAQAQDLTEPNGPLSTPSIPLSGTFWFAQLTNQPPLPLNPLPDLPVYALGTNTYLVDDRAVNYVELRAEQQAEAAWRTALADASLEAQMSGTPPPPGDPGTGIDVLPPAVPAFQLNGQLGFLSPGWAGTNAFELTLTNAGAGEVFDLYYTTNLSPNVALPELSLTNWAWLCRGAPGQTHWSVTNLVFEQCFFRVGTMADTDGDLLPDAYERLVSHTAVDQFTTLSGDGQGTPVAWYLRYGLPGGSASGDPNGDGLTNAESYRAGLDPRAATSIQVWVSAPGSAGLP